MRLKRVKRHLTRRAAKQAAAFVLGVTLLGGCSGNEPQHEAAVQEGAAALQVNVKAETVGKQKVSDMLVRVGDVAPSAQFDLLTKVGGTVEKIWKKRGDMVQEGELLVTLSSADARYRKERAALELQTVQNALVESKQKAIRDLESSKQTMDISIQRTQMNLEQANRNYNKLRNDYDDGLATTDQVVQAENQLKSTQLDLDQQKSQRSMMDQQKNSFTDMETKLRDAEMSLKQAQQVVDSLEIKAPMSGILTEFPSEAGVTLQDGAKLGVLQKLDPALIRAQLTEDEARVIRMKKELVFTVQGSGKSATAQIRYLANIMDAQTKSYELDLEVGNKDLALMPGYKAQLQLTTEQDRVALAVPTYSIVKEGEDSFVYIYAGGKVSKRRVQLGRLSEPYQEVVSGVEAGEQIVVSGLSKLHDQDRVTPAAGQN